MKLNATVVTVGIEFKEYLLKTYILLFHSLIDDGKCF